MIHVTLYKSLHYAKNPVFIRFSLMFWNRFFLSLSFELTRVWRFLSFVTRKAPAPFDKQNVKILSSFEKPRFCNFLFTRSTIDSTFRPPDLSFIQVSRTPFFNRSGLLYKIWPPRWFFQTATEKIPASIRVFCLYYTKTSFKSNS